jgi:hypothetical protein
MLAAPPQSPLPAGCTPYGWRRLSSACFERFGSGASAIGGGENGRSKIHPRVEDSEIGRDRAGQRSRQLASRFPRTSKMLRLRRLLFAEEEELVHTLQVRKTTASKKEQDKKDKKFKRSFLCLTTSTSPTAVCRLVLTSPPPQRRPPPTGPPSPGCTWSSRRRPPPPTRPTHGR